MIVKVVGQGTVSILSPRYFGNTTRMFYQKFQLVRLMSSVFPSTSVSLRNSHPLPDQQTSLIDLCKEYVLSHESIHFISNRHFYVTKY